MEINGFRHKYSVKVQFHEVDLLGVCNNAIYFNFFETARLEYLKTIGQYKEMEDALNSQEFYLIVHNECDYLEPAYYDDELNIYSRVKYIKNSSFCFEHVIENNSTKKIIAKGNAVIVYINRKLKKSIPIPDEFYEKVKSFDEAVEILKGS